MIRIIRRISALCTLPLAALLSASPAHAQAAPASPTPFTATHRPLEFGALAQGGLGVTDDRSDFKFFMLGGQAGKVLTPDVGPGLLHGNFEYGIQIFPFWQSYTPQIERRTCTAPGACSAPYKTGGTYTGISITPILLRWNFTGSGHRKIMPWVAGWRRTDLDQSQVSPASADLPTTRSPTARPPIPVSGTSPRSSAWALHYFLTAAPVPRFWRQCRPHLLGLSWRQEPRRQREHTILCRLHLVEVTPASLQTPGLES